MYKNGRVLACPVELGVWARKSMQVFMRRYGLGASAGLHVLTHLQDRRTPASPASIPRDACAALCPQAGQTRPDSGYLSPVFDCVPSSPLSPTSISYKTLSCPASQRDWGQPTPLISGFPPTGTDFHELSAWGSPLSPLSLCRRHLLRA